MSTKIYNAYKIQTSSLDEAYKKLKKLGTILNKEADIIFTNKILTDAYKKWCKIVWYNSNGSSKKRLADVLLDFSKSENDLQELDREKKGIILLKNFSHLIEEHRKSPQKRSLYDTACEACILPYKGEIYCIFFCENQDMMNTIGRRRWLKDYSYWNNTDRPEECTAIEWGKRKATWEGIFKKNSTPKDAGFVFTLAENKETCFHKIETFQKAQFCMTEEMHQKAKKEYLLDILCTESIKDPIVEITYKKNPFSIIMLAGDIIRGDKTFLHEQEAKVMIKIWEKIEKDFEDFEFSKPEFSDLFNSVSELEKQQELSALKSIEQQNKKFNAPKL